MRNFTFRCAALAVLTIGALSQVQSQTLPEENLPKTWSSIPEAPADFNAPVPTEATAFSPGQIDHVYRWYALENEYNDDYWNKVNVSQLWLELELGVSLMDDQISSFLNEFGLLKINAQSKNTEVTNYYVFEIDNPSKELTLSLVKAAAEVPGILFAEPSAIYKKFFTPNDPFWNNQWGPYVIYADEAWNTVTGGSWNIVGVVDDAIDWNHEDLYDAVWYGDDFGNLDADPTPDDPSQSHGTHVTGTIAASINNNIGIAGMVNDTVYFAKVTDATYDPNIGNFSDVAITDALYFMGDVDRIRVINMSLGGGPANAAQENACIYAWNQGKFIAVASGNDGSGTISYPAAYDACTAVGAIGSDGTNLYLTSYSQFGDQQELCAPGGDLYTGYGILSCYPNNNYEYLQGTSMACPHVAGLAGLLFAQNSNLSNADVRTVLAATAFDFGDTGWDPFFGYGMINALGAVEMVADGGVVSTESINQDNITIFPNPFNDHLNIAVGNALVQGVKIFNLNGSLVFDQIVGSTPVLTVNTDDLASGMYIMEVTTENGESKFKITK